VCFGVPGKIVEIHEVGGLKMGKVDFGGVFREACLEYVSQAQVSDYVVIHVGFALTLLNEEEARASIETLRELVDAGARLD